ncbi:MAG TPA: hypothetical protein VGC09_15935 [Rhodopila sp.]
MQEPRESARILALISRPDGSDWSFLKLSQSAWVNADAGTCDNIIAATAPLMTSPGVLSIIAFPLVFAVNATKVAGFHPSAPRRWLLVRGRRKSEAAQAIK